MSFASSSFAQFLAGRSGRLLRIAAGIALIAAGFVLRDSPAGIILMVVGVVPLAAGVFDFCILSPLFGGPFSGSRIRACRRP